jgi:hypothetical protein
LIHVLTSLTTPWPPQKAANPLDYFVLPPLRDRAGTTASRDSGVPGQEIPRKSGQSGSGPLRSLFHLAGSGTAQDHEIYDALAAADRNFELR